jgi:hypothetical protein
MRSVTRALVIAAIAVGSRVALAQTSQADELFFQARQLVTGGKYDEACPMFERSQAMRPGIGTLLNLGDCYEKQNKAVAAYKTFRDARDAAKRAGDPRETIAITRMGSLAPRVTVVRVVIEPASDVAGLAVALDGVAIDRAALAEIVVDRGAHKLTVTAPDKSPLELPVDASSQTADVRVAFPSPVVAEEQTTTPVATPRSPLRTIGIVVGGAGVAAIVTGVIFGVASIANKGTGDTHCKLGPSADACDGAGLDARNAALTFGDFSTAFFVAGAVALAAGIVMWAVAPHASSRRGSLPLRWTF